MVKFDKFKDNSHNNACVSYFKDMGYTAKIKGENIVIDGNDENTISYLFNKFVQIAILNG